MFGSSRNYLASLLLRVQSGSEEREVDTLGRSAGEYQVTIRSIEDLLNAIPALIHFRGDPTTWLMSDAARVSELRHHPGEHGIDHARVGTGCRVIIEIDFALQARSSFGSFAVEECDTKVSPHILAKHRDTDTLRHCKSNRLADPALEVHSLEDEIAQCGDRHRDSVGKQKHFRFAFRSPLEEGFRILHLHKFTDEHVELLKVLSPTA